jgi:hypothetical protein
MPVEVLSIGFINGGGIKNEDHRTKFELGGITERRKQEEREWN